MQTIPSSVIPLRLKYIGRYFFYLTASFLFAVIGTRRLLASRPVYLTLTNVYLNSTNRTRNTSVSNTPILFLELSISTQQHPYPSLILFSPTSSYLQFRYLEWFASPLLYRTSFSPRDFRGSYIWSPPRGGSTTPDCRTSQVIKKQSNR
jgi:hypothetical protein